MPDEPLASRLAPGLTPAAWRAFINGLVFLFPAAGAAERFRAAEPDRDQRIVSWSTAALVAAGCDLRCCAWNNGYLDRLPPSRRRLRSRADYRPIMCWTPGERVAEVAIPGGIPAGCPPSSVRESFVTSYPGPLGSERGQRTG